MKTTKNDPIYCVCMLMFTIIIFSQIFYFFYSWHFMTFIVSFNSIPWFARHKCYNYRGFVIKLKLFQLDLLKIKNVEKTRIYTLNIKVYLFKRNISEFKILVISYKKCQLFPFATGLWEMRPQNNRFLHSITNKIIIFSHFFYQT